MKFLNNIKHSIKLRGTRGALLHLTKKIARKTMVDRLSLVEDSDKTRLRLSNHFFELFNGEVKYGVLQGFKINHESWWSTHDIAPKLFGLYEQEIQAELYQLSRTKEVFIDIGAADGFYGVSMVSQNMYNKSYCFEISEEGQKIIKNTALINKTDNVYINGVANKNSLESIPNNELTQSVVLIDIEGDEFRFLSDDIIEIFKNSTIIIELHDWFFDDGDTQKSNLRKRLEKHFNIKPITTSSRDLSTLQELEQLNDNERWLICSEGRGRRMEWWSCTPLEEQPE